MMSVPLNRVAAIAFLALFLRQHTHRTEATLPWGITLQIVTHQTDLTDLKKNPMRKGTSPL